MEQLNKVELRGNVGSVRLQKVGERQVARLTLATNYAYKDKNGAPQIETTWHTVIAWQGKGIECLESLNKGDKVYVLGRIRQDRFTGADEIERVSFEIVARRMEIIRNEEILNYEM